MLYRFLATQGYRHIYPNIVINGFEADLLLVNKSKYLSEYEIKTNKSDFIRDFTHRNAKHKNLKRGTRVAVSNKPNYFWFVVAFQAKKIEDFPPHAGLMEAKRKTHHEKCDFVKIEVLKQPQLLHRSNVNTDFVDKLNQRCLYKYGQLHSKCIDCEPPRQRVNATGALGWGTKPN